MKNLLLATCFLAFITSSCSVETKTSKIPLPENIIFSVVMVKGTIGVGSGTVFKSPVDNKYYVLTAAHLFADPVATSKFLSLSDLMLGDIKVNVQGREEKSGLFYWNEELDMAVLKLDIEPESYINVFNLEEPSYVDVIEVHYPGLIGPIITKGVGTVKSDRFKNLFLVSGFVFPGSSGGAVFDENCKYLGMILGMPSEEKGVNPITQIGYCLSSKIIIEKLKELKLY